MTKKLNDAERLARLLKELAPDGARVAVEAPTGRGRTWRIEVEHDGHLVSAEWSGDEFGIRTPTGDDYGSAPSEEVSDWKAAGLRMLHLAESRQQARPRREMYLRELRDAREASQAAVAEAMKSSQAHVSQTERRDDMLVSTLREFIEALGGELELVARFKGESVPLQLRDGDAKKRAG